VGKFISFFTAVVFSAQAVLGSFAEANFWQERQKNIQEKNNVRKEELASLPFPSPEINPLKFPLDSNLSPLNSLAPAPYSGLNSGTLSSKFSPRLITLLRALPAAACRINEVYEAESMKSPPVVLVQDVHLNTEAQRNIAKLLQSLIYQRQVGLVGVEGSFGPFDFAPFRSLPDSRITREVAEEFLKENLMGAPSFAGITSPAPIPEFTGVDDEAHYQANVAAVLEGGTFRKKTLASIENLERENKASKEKLLNPRLKIFDRLWTNYRKRELGIGPYLERLSGLGVKAGPSIREFLDAYQLEKSLDSAKVDLERRAVLEKLAGRLSREETSELFNLSLAYRSNQIGFASFYEYLQNLCGKKGISLESTPAFRGYIRYVLLAEKIRAEELFKETGEWEDKILENLAKNSAEKELVLEGQRLSLAVKLANFELTAEDWEKYKKSVPRPSSLVPRANLFKSVNEGRGTRDVFSLSPFESFYREADIRSEKMAENLLSVIASHERSEGRSNLMRLLRRPPRRAPRNDIAVLITGGFHTPKIKEILKKKGISYLVVSPRISKLDNASGNEYLSVFSREKTPLEKLFSSEKLSIYPSSLSLGAMVREALSRARMFLAVAAVRSFHAGKKISAKSGVAVQAVANGFYQAAVTIWGTSVTVFLSVGGTAAKGYKSVGNLAGLGAWIPKPSFWSQWKPAAAKFRQFLRTMPGVFGESGRLNAWLVQAKDMARNWTVGDWARLGTAACLLLFFGKFGLSSESLKFYLAGIPFLIALSLATPNGGPARRRIPLRELLPLLEKSPEEIAQALTEKYAGFRVWPLFKKLSLKKAAEVLACFPPAEAAQYLEDPGIKELKAARILEALSEIKFDFAAEVLWNLSHKRDEALKIVSPHLKIAMVGAEVDGFGKVGGVADVIADLSSELADLGHEVSVFVPLHSGIDRTQLKDTGIEVPVPMPGGERSARLWIAQLGKVKIYFLGEDNYFGKGPLYGNEESPDKWVFFNKAVLEAMRKLNYQADVVHSHDWHAGLLPVFMKEFYNKKGISFFREAKSVYTIHNLKFPGKFSKASYGMTGLPWEYVNTPTAGLEFHGDWSFAKAGMYFADVTTAVSPQYAKEVQTEERGEGFHGLLETLASAGRLVGIRNGLNDDWRSEVNKQIQFQFDAKHLELKDENKIALQRELGLEENPQRTLMGMVLRIDRFQKGVGLLADRFPDYVRQLRGLDFEDEIQVLVDKLEINGRKIDRAKAEDLVNTPLFVIAKEGTQVVIHGEAAATDEGGKLLERRLEEIGLAINALYPGRAHINMKYEPNPARIFAAADIAINPSLYEPFGLLAVQQAALGAVPIVRDTGGLRDSFEQFDPKTGEGNAFKFKEFLPEALLGSVVDALHLRKERPDLWKKLQVNCMEKDFGWEEPAEDYVRIYRPPPSHSLAGIDPGWGPVLALGLLVLFLGLHFYGAGAGILIGFPIAIAWAGRSLFNPGSGREKPKDTGIDLSGQPEGNQPGRKIVYFDSTQVGPDDADEIVARLEEEKTALEHEGKKLVILLDYSPLWRSRFPAGEAFEFDSDGLVKPVLDEVTKAELESDFTGDIETMKVDVLRSYHGKLGKRYHHKDPIIKKTLKWANGKRVPITLIMGDFETWAKSVFVENYWAKVCEQVFSDPDLPTKERTLRFRQNLDFSANLSARIYREKLLAISKVVETFIRGYEGKASFVYLGKRYPAAGRTVTVPEIQSVIGKMNSSLLEPGIVESTDMASYAMLLARGGSLDDEPKLSLYLRFFIATILDSMAIEKNRRNPVERFAMVHRVAARADLKVIRGALTSPPNRALVVESLRYWLAEFGSPEEKEFFGVPLVLPSLDSPELGIIAMPHTLQSPGSSQPHIVIWNEEFLQHLVPLPANLDPQLSNELITGIRALLGSFPKPELNMKRELWAKICLWLQMDLENFKKDFDGFFTGRFERLSSQQVSALLELKGKIQKIKGGPREGWVNPGAWAGFFSWFGVKTPPHQNQAGALFGKLAAVEGLITGAVILFNQSNLWAAVYWWLGINLAFHFLGVFSRDPRTGKWEILRPWNPRGPPLQFYWPFFKAYLFANLIASFSLLGLIPAAFDLNPLLILIAAIVPHAVLNFLAPLTLKKVSLRGGVVAFCRRSNLTFHNFMGLLRPSLREGLAMTHFLTRWRQISLFTIFFTFLIFSPLSIAQKGFLLPVGLQIVLQALPAREASVAPQFVSPFTAGFRNVVGTYFPLFQMKSKRGEGIGDFDVAKIAVDIHAECGANLMAWTPFNPSAANNSPYTSWSPRALDPIYISLKALLKALKSKYDKKSIRKILDEYEKETEPLLDKDRVPYGDVLRIKSATMRKIWGVVKINKGTGFYRQFEKFMSAREEDLAEDMLYITLKEKYMREEKPNPKHPSYTREWDWRLWEARLRDRDPEALRQARQDNREEILFHWFEQFVAFSQFEELLSYAKERGVNLKVDIPIGRDGVDAWVHAKTIFGLAEKNGYRRITTMGVPGDDYADFQYWQNYLYDWSHPETIRYWLKLLKYYLNLGCYIRLDHALGFYRNFHVLEDIDGKMTLKGLGLYTALHGYQEKVKAHWEKGETGKAGEKAREAEQALRRRLMEMYDTVPEFLKDTLHPDAIRHTFSRDGEIREGCTVLLARQVPEKELENKLPEDSPWTRLKPTEKLVYHDQPKWDFIRATDYKNGPKGKMLQYLLGNEITPEDSVRPAYFKMAPGEAILSEFFRLSQEAGIPIILETLGAVDPLIQKSTERQGGTNFIAGVWGEKKNQDGHPANHIPNALATYGLQDSVGMRFRWEKEITTETRLEVLREMFPKGNWFSKDETELTPRVHRALLKRLALSPARMLVLMWNDILGLDDSYRVNIPGKEENQWESIIPIYLEDLLAAAKGDPSAPKEAKRAVRMFKALIKISDRQKPKIEPGEKPKLHHVDPEPGGKVYQFRQIKTDPSETHPFQVDAYVIGKTTKDLNLLVEGPSGEKISIPMISIPIDPASYKHGLSEEVYKWTGFFKPEKVGLYKFYVEIPETKEKSVKGYLMAVEENADQNPLSTTYRPAELSKGSIPLGYMDRQELKAPMKGGLFATSDLWLELGVSPEDAVGGWWFYGTLETLLTLMVFWASEILLLEKLPLYWPALVIPHVLGIIICSVLSTVFFVRLLHNKVFLFMVEGENGAAPRIVPKEVEKGRARFLIRLKLLGIGLIFHLPYFLVWGFYYSFPTVAGFKWGIALTVYWAFITHWIYIQIFTKDDQPNLKKWLMKHGVPIGTSPGWFGLFPASSKRSGVQGVSDILAGKEIRVSDIDGGNTRPIEPAGNPLPVGPKMSWEKLSRAATMVLLVSHLAMSLYSTDLKMAGLSLALLAPVAMSLFGTPMIQKNQKVLLLEDEKDLAETIRTVLERRGYEVVHASSGEQALEFLSGADSSFDIFLSDINLRNSQISGDQFFRQTQILRKSGPTIFITSLSDEKLAGLRIPAGIPIIHKPFSARELLSTLNKARFTRRAVETISRLEVLGPTDRRAAIELGWKTWELNRGPLNRIDNYLNRGELSPGFLFVEFFSSILAEDKPGLAENLKTIQMKLEENPNDLFLWQLWVKTNNKASNGERRAARVIQNRPNDLAVKVPWGDEVLGWRSVIENRNLIFQGPTGTENDQPSRLLREAFLWFAITNGQEYSVLNLEGHPHFGYLEIALTGTPWTSLVRDGITKVYLQLDPNNHEFERLLLNRVTDSEVRKLRSSSGPFDLPFSSDNFWGFIFLIVGVGALACSVPLFVALIPSAKASLLMLPLLALSFIPGSNALKAFGKIQTSARRIIFEIKRSARKSVYGSLEKVLQETPQNYLDLVTIPEGTPGEEIETILARLVRTRPAGKHPDTLVVTTKNMEGSLRRIVETKFGNPSWLRPIIRENIFVQRFGESVTRLELKNLEQLLAEEKLPLLPVRLLVPANVFVDFAGILRGSPFLTAIFILIKTDGALAIDRLTLEERQRQAVKRLEYA